MVKIKLQVWIFIFFFVLNAGVHSQPLKILYLGNSHTFWNDLPQMIYELALSKGDSIEFESNTPGGCTWGHPSNGHLFNQQSLSLINSKDWDYVVLQEHSLFAVIEYYRDTYMFPAAAALDSLIKLNYPCTKTIVRDIWAKKQGGQHCINTYCSITFSDFSHMQDSLTVEYLKVADMISGIVSPAGEAWRTSIENGDPIELFDIDESHPSLAGSYLTACVYYALIFQKPSEGAPFSSGLSFIEAQYLQQIADQIVLSDPEIWFFNHDTVVAGFDYSQIENKVLFSDKSVNADHFHWDFGDGMTDTVRHPVHVYSETGTYTVKQFASSACDADSITDTVTVDHIIGMPGYTIQDVKIIPGGSPGVYIIRSPDLLLESIKVYTLGAIQVRSEAMLHSKEFILDLRSSEKGLYILVIQTSIGIRNYKIQY